MKKEDLLSEISFLEKKAIFEIKSSSSLKDLEKIRLIYFGKKGIIKVYFNELKKLRNLERRSNLGALVNLLCRNLDSLIKKKRTELKIKEVDYKLQNEAVDITLPIRNEKIGVVHPLSMVINEVKFIFMNMGFKLVDGPDIEDEFHVFDALNTPNYHPAREDQDTFYLKNKIKNKRMVLRTHTSSIQVRVMKNAKTFPIKIITIGRVYRNDFDATHTPMFHQIEGLYVNQNVNMGELKFIIHYFLNKFFGEDRVKIRFRNSFFPFTEPSAEVDVMYCDHSSSSVWVEVLGCGMVHPNVFQKVGINNIEYNGFAFGIGIERLAMLKYHISDIRNFYDNKVAWLRHYGFNFLFLK